jgi:prevent-host-death family protein
MGLTMMAAISAREANQRFSDLLGRAARGESVIITRRGTPVAVLSPYQASDRGDNRGLAWERLTTMLKDGLSLGGDTFSREEAHER